MRSVRLFWLVVFALFTSTYSQSTWDYVGLSRSEIIRKLGPGLDNPANNSLVYVGPSDEYAVTTAFTFQFNSRSVVKKVVFTAIYRTKALAKKYKQILTDRIISNDFYEIGTDKFSNGERTITISTESKGGMFAVSATSI